MRSSRDRTSTALLALVIVVALAVAASALGARTGVGTSTETSSATASTARGSSQLENSTAGAASGVQLSLVLNATKLAQGGAINATAYVTNTLPVQLNLTFGALAPDPLFYENAPPCASSTPVAVIKVSQGYFVASNLTQATPLQTWAPVPPGAPPECPYLGFPIYPLLPQSDDFNGSVLAKENGFYLAVPYPASVAIVSGAYYATDYGNGQQVATPFPAGVYTVSVSDAWGQIAILHFEVAAG
jgi:hypothetical protein